MVKNKTDFSFSPELIPKKGYILAYFKEMILFKPYMLENGEIKFDGCEILQKEIPSECHMFDEDTEYRLVCRESHNDVIELVLTKQQEKEMIPDLVYSQDVMVKKEYVGSYDVPEYITITSRYEYSEYDTLTLNNYRISY